MNHLGQSLPPYYEPPFDLLTKHFRETFPRTNLINYDVFLCSFFCFFLSFLHVFLFSSSMFQCCCCRSCFDCVLSCTTLSPLSIRHRISGLQKCQYFHRRPTVFPTHNNRHRCVISTHHHRIAVSARLIRKRTGANSINIFTGR